MYISHQPVSAAPSDVKSRLFSLLYIVYSLVEMGCYYITGLSCGRMVTWNVVTILVLCLLVAPSSTRSISLSTRVLQLLRNKYADQLPQGNLDLTPKQQDYDTSQTGKNVDLSPTYINGMSKRYSPSLRQLLLNQPERRGRLSIGMTLDALSDMLSAERRRHYKQQALKAQNSLHRLGKRSLTSRHLW